MTVFVSFTMGAKEAYFFNSPTHWAWHNLPPDVEALFTKSPPLKDVLELALGDNGTYFVSYRDHDGQIYCRHYNLPNPLTTYLYHSHPHVIRDLSTLSITLGPYESYYAYDKTSASWANLPASLEKAVLARLESQDAFKTVWKADGAEAPSYVCLGGDGSYFMRTVSGGGSWELKSKADGMKGINKFLEDSSSFNGIAGLYLFSHYPDSYVLLQTSGKAFSNLPEHTWADYNKMAPSLPNLVQTLSPIPPMPQPRIQTPQQQPLPPQQNLQPPQPFQQQQHFQQQPQAFSPQPQQQQQQMYTQPNYQQQSPAGSYPPGNPLSPNPGYAQSPTPSMAPPAYGYTPPGYQQGHNANQYGNTPYTGQTTGVIGGRLVGQGGYNAGGMGPGTS